MTHATSSVSPERPRRRQRNASEDSVAHRQPVKRRKRTGLSKELFKGPDETEDSRAPNGDVHHSQSNGSAQRHDKPVANGVHHQPLRRNERVSSGGKGATAGRNYGKELTRTRQYATSQLPNTPRALLEADLTGKWRVDFASPTGYAVAVSHTQLIVWSVMSKTGAAHQDANYHIPLLESFASSGGPLPFAAVVSTSSDCGLLVLSPNSGKCVSWENLSTAASTDRKRQRQQAVHATINGLMSNESLTSITEAEARGFVLSFDTGRLAHLWIDDSQGRPEIRTNFLRTGPSQSQGLLSSLRNVLSLNSWKSEYAAVKGGRTAERGQRYIVTATKQARFQIWSVLWNGTHSLAADADAQGAMQDALSETDQATELTSGSIEVLDFSVLPLADREQKNIDSKANHKLLVLVTQQFVNEPKFALISMTILTDGVQIHEVSDLKIDPPSDLTITFKPKILVADPWDTACVVFEQSIALVSIRDHSANDVHDSMRTDRNASPLQTQLKYHTSQSYSSIGCGVVASARSSPKTPYLILINNFGIISLRCLEEASQNKEENDDPNVALAQSQLEQVVFYGSRHQPLFDFSPCQSSSFQIEDVAMAAVRISRSITSASSPYLSTLTLSMDQQLSSRALALADLNSYLRKHYEQLPLVTKWQLLWDAEKLAAARKLWRQYDDMISNSAKSSKNVFAEMIEAIPVQYKLENRPDCAETDLVRHWFIHDIWQLEWVLPYSHEIMNLLYRESVEDDEELDLLTRARLVTDVVEIQKGTLLTAFEFRSDNAMSYGIDADQLEDGVLGSVEDFANLPEFWTSSAAVTSRVKEMVDVGRETAKLLASSLDDLVAKQEEADTEANDVESEEYAENLHSAMMRLAKMNPVQIEACSQSLLERSRWLLSKNDAKLQKEGRQFDKAQRSVRGKLILELVDLDMTEEALHLAEKYIDMDIVVEILERERDNPSFAPSIPARVNRYFTQFGTRWGDVYFPYYLSRGDEAVKILTNAQTPYKQYLTEYLREHPDYAKVAWLTQASLERDYLAAAMSLQTAADQTESLWGSRVSSSLSKLSLLAAQSAKQIDSEAVAPMSHLLDHQLQIDRIQGDASRMVCEALVDALDDEARLDLAIDLFSTPSIHKIPPSTDIFRLSMQKLIRGERLSPFELADLLSRMSYEPTSQRTPKKKKQDEISAVRKFFFFPALQVLDLASESSSSPSLVTESVLQLSKIIWRRMFNASDWINLNRTEDKSDNDIKSRIAETALFQTILAGYKHHMNKTHEDETRSFWDMSPIYIPSDVLKTGTDILTIQTTPPFINLPLPEQESILDTFKSESAQLEHNMTQGRLESWLDGIRTDASRVAQQDVLEMQNEEERRGQVETLFNKLAKEQDRVQFLVDGRDPCRIDFPGGKKMGLEGVGRDLYLS